MGLNQNNGNTGGNILYVKRGAICMESKTPREGFEEDSGDVNGRPYTKYYKKFGSLDHCMVETITWYDTEDQYDTRYQGLKLGIHTTDTNEDFILDLPYATKPYDTFTRFAENIDFTKEVEFLAYPDKEHRESTVFNAKQDGQIIRQKYTKNNLGDCPEATKNKRTGEWDFSAQREWLLDNLLDNVASKLGNKTMVATATEDRWAGVHDPIHED